MLNLIYKDREYRNKDMLGMLLFILFTTTDDRKNKRCLHTFIQTVGNVIPSEVYVSMQWLEIDRHIHPEVHFHLTFS